MGTFPDLKMYDVNAISEKEFVGKMAENLVPLREYFNDRSSRQTGNGFVERVKQNKSRKLAVRKGELEARASKNIQSVCKQK